MLLYAPYRNFICINLTDLVLKVSNSDMPYVG